MGAWHCTRGTLGLVMTNAVAGRVELSEERCGRNKVFSSWIRQPIFKVACQLTHVGCVAESLQFVFCGFDVDAQSLADLVRSYRLSSLTRLPKAAQLRGGI